MGTEPFLMHGARITLRDWRVEDIVSLHDWLKPHHRWNDFDGPYFPRPTVEESDAFCTKLMDQVTHREWETPRRRVAITIPPDNRLIGMVSWYWESRETNWRRVGITLYDPAYWGQGIGTEALALWTMYLFHTTDIVRLDFATWSGNVGMMRVGEKLGFTLEGRFRKARIVRGEYFDSVVMGVLREEWEEQRSGL